MCPSIVHPGIVPDAANAPLVLKGLTASPSADRIEMNSLITTSDYVTMTRDPLGETPERLWQQNYRVTQTKVTRSEWRSIGTKKTESSFHYFRSPATLDVTPSRRSRLCARVLRSDIRRFPHST